MKKTLKTLLFCTFFAVQFSTLSYADGILDDRIILLDAGHGAGYNTWEDYCEGDTMLILAKKLVPLLEDAGATVYEIRPDEENIDLQVRSALINKISLEFLLEAKNTAKNTATDDELAILEAEILEITSLIENMQEIIDDPSISSLYLNSPYSKYNEITDELLAIFDYQTDIEISSRFLMLSMHTNASSSTSSNGALMLFEPFDEDDKYIYYDNYAHVEQETFFAEAMLSQLELLGFANAGYRASNLHMIRENNVPSILVEAGFHTNDYDRALITGDENLDNLAMAYYNAIVEYYTSEIVPEIPENGILIEETTTKNDIILKFTNVLIPLASGNFLDLLNNITAIIS